jgi:16S rRNA (cytosine967-C5)-methyltransferase
LSCFDDDEEPSEAHPYREDEINSMTDDDKAQDRRLARSLVAGGRLRALLLELWQRTRIDWGFVTDRLSLTFRKETWIGANERRFVAETLYGLVRQLRRIDAGLAAGSRRTASPRDLERLIGYLVLEGVLEPADATHALPDLDWNAVRAIDDRIAAERNMAKRIALACSLPDWMAERFVSDWGAEAEKLAHGLNQRAPMTVRANLLKTTRDELAARLAAEKIASHPGRWADTALHVDTRTNLFGLAAFKEGGMEAQDEGSQLLADLARPDPGSRGTVIDLCAGAGGKTLALAARMGNRGRLVASDVDAAKLDELRRRARRAGVSNAQATHLAAADADLPPPLAAQVGKAERVLVDAPCSGVGALRRNPEARWRLQEADLAGFATRQRAICERSAALVAPGGWLVYGTCTLLSVENQAVVDAVLAARSELELIPASEVVTDRSLATDDGRYFTSRPDRHGTDGFFGAILRRRAEP